MSSETILCVDDDESIREVLDLLLKSEGYETITAKNGQEAIEKMSDEIDLVILDVMMPVMDGFEACQRIREKYKVPILFLTAKSLMKDKEKGFLLGGDDYLIKPFEYSELILRVNAMIRRYYDYGAKQGTSRENEIIELYGDVQVNLALNQATSKGKVLKLTEIEYRILCLLATNKKKIFSVQQIYEEVWKEKYFYSSNNTVMVHIRNLRKKLGDDLKDSKIIQTVWGRGYKVE